MSHAAGKYRDDPDVVAFLETVTVLAPEDAPGPGELHVDDLPVPVQGGVTVNNLNSFPRKVGLGATGRDSDEIQSVWEIANLSGGGQIFTRNEAVDGNRYRDGDAHARDPYLLTNGRETEEYDGGATANTWPLESLNGITYLSFDKKIRAFDPDTESFGADIATLDFHPSGKSFVFDAGAPGASDPVIWIPHGEDGYSTFDGSAETAHTDAKPVRFVEFADELWCLETTGHLSSWDGSAWTQMHQLPRRHTPRNVVSYYNASQEPTLHVATDRTMFAFDISGPKFYPTVIQDRTGAHVGHGMAVWSTQGNLFLTDGMGLDRYEIGATNSPAGLDRNDGLPYELRGWYVDIAPSRNELWEFVRGAEAITEAPDSIEADTIGPDSPTFPTVTSYASVHFMTQSGHFKQWSSAGAAGEPTCLLVAKSGDQTRVWWGYGGTAYAVLIPDDGHNPSEGLRAGIDRFSPVSDLYTGKFNAQMIGYVKIASYLQCNMRFCGANDRIEVRYQADLETDWTLLGTFSGVGIQTIEFPGDGLPFEQLELWFRFLRDEDDRFTAPLADAFVLHFVKNPHPAKSWAWTTPVAWGQDSEYAGFGDPADLKLYLDAKLAKNGFVRLGHEGYEYRVRLSQTNGSDATGPDVRGVRQLSAIEVPRYRGGRVIPAVEP